VRRQVVEHHDLAGPQRPHERVLGEGAHEPHTDPLRGSGSDPGQADWN
jgi:hypothetical protein